jgi:hypothetical protein
MQVMIDTAVIVWGLLFGSIGIGYFIYGRKQSNSLVKYVGLILMVFPYFVENVLLLVVVGVSLMFVPKFLKL